MHGKIVSIHYLRGLCALLVVVAHLSYLLPGHMEARIPGALGVDLFFMISGFIMLLVTRERAEPPSTFIIKRFVRIYPLFFVVWLLAVLTVHRDATLGQSLCALALCLQDYASQGPEFGYNLLGPPWTLTYEVYFYLLFCGAMALSPRWRGPICALAIGILTVGLQLAVNGSYALSSQSAARFADTRGWQAPLTILSDTVFYEFVFGMLVAALLPRLAALKEHACCAGPVWRCWGWPWRPHSWSGRCRSAWPVASGSRPRSSPPWWCWGRRSACRPCARCRFSATSPTRCTWSTFR